MTKLPEELQSPMAAIEADRQRRKHNFYVGWAAAFKGSTDSECEARFGREWHNGISAGFWSKVSARRKLTP